MSEKINPREFEELAKLREKVKQSLVDGPEFSCWTG